MSDELFNLQTKVTPSSEFVTEAKSSLNELVHATSGVDGVLLASADGFEVVSIFQKSYDAAKLSAVGSSILALVKALTVEAKLTGCRSIILDAENGKIMISTVPNANQPMILVVMTRQQILLGQLMHATNKTINALVELDKAHHSIAP